MPLEWPKSFVRRTRAQKRVQHLSLLLMGVTPIVFLGWDPLHSDMLILADRSDCEARADSLTAVCEALAREAQARHRKIAPRYQSLAACEAEFAHVKDRESCARGWCGGESVLGCEQGEDGLYRPQFSGFLVSRDLFESALESRSVPAHIDETALQPIYGVADRSLYDKAPDDGALQAGGYGGGRYSTSDQHLQTAFEWYYFMSNGRYLGTVRTKDSVVMAKLHLVPEPAKVYRGTSKRGGFGATARGHMVAAAS